MGRKQKPVMATDRLSVRVTPDIAKRADALVPAIAKVMAPQGVTRVTRSVVIKQALEEGLKVLEAKHGGK